MNKRTYARTQPNQCYSFFQFRKPRSFSLRAIRHSHSVVFVNRMNKHSFLRTVSEFIGRETNFCARYENYFDEIELVHQHQHQLFRSVKCLPVARVNRGKNKSKLGRTVM